MVVTRPSTTIEASDNRVITIGSVSVEDRSCLHADPDGPGDPVFSDDDVDVDVRSRVTGRRSHAEPGQRRRRYAHPNDTDRLTLQNGFADKQQRPAFCRSCYSRSRRPLQLAPELPESESDDDCGGNSGALPPHAARAFFTPSSVCTIPRRQYCCFDVRWCLDVCLVLAKDVERIGQIGVFELH
jgi:hypothetical protein